MSADEEIRVITPDYLRVLQTPLLAGVSSPKSDNSDAPGVVIINQALAKKYWPNEEALGKRITFAIEQPDPKWLTIVGIVRNIRHRGLDVDPAPEYYVPHPQRPIAKWFWPFAARKIRAVLSRPCVAKFGRFDPEQPMANVRTLER